MAMKQLSRMSLSWCPLAAALSLWLLWGAGCSEVKSASPQETPSAPAVPVTVIQVTPRTIPIYGEYTGTTDATETAEIRARVDGYIDQRLFDAGQLVKANELLYVLDQRTYNAELQKAKAKVAKAEADLQFAKEGVEVLRAESRLAQSQGGAGQGRPGCGALSAAGEAGGGPKDRLGYRAGAATGAQGRSECSQGRIDPNEAPTAHTDRAGGGRAGIRSGDATPGRIESRITRRSRRR